MENMKECSELLANDLLVTTERRERDGRERERSRTCCKQASVKDSYPATYINHMYGE